jgi:hypothetical protein
MATQFSGAARLASATLVAALCGAMLWLASSWLSGVAVGPLDIAQGAAIILLASAVGLGCGIGGALGRRALVVHPSPRRSTAWLAWSGAAVATALPFGALWGTVFVRHIVIAQSAAVMLVVAVVEMVAAGMLMGHSAALQQGVGTFARGGIAAITGVLHGAAFGLAYGAMWAAFYQNYCLSHMYCLESSPLAGLQIGLIAGPLAGLALGVVAALSIAVAFAVVQPAERMAAS